MNEQKLIRVLALFREYEADIPVGCIMAFLYLMNNPGATVSQVIHDLGFTKQSASRNMRNLTHRARPGKEGINVCRTEPDDNDYRIHRWFLNQRGEELKAKIQAIFDG